MCFCEENETAARFPLFVHYDLQKLVRLASDASPCGVEDVISFVREDGAKKQLPFGSSTLSASKDSYPRLNKSDFHCLWSEEVLFVPL